MIGVLASYPVSWGQAFDSRGSVPSTVTLGEGAQCLFVSEASESLVEHQNKVKGRNTQVMWPDPTARGSSAGVGRAWHVLLHL